MLEMRSFTFAVILVLASFMSGTAHSFEFLHRMVFKVFGEEVFEGTIHLDEGQIARIRLPNRPAGHILVSLQPDRPWFSLSNFIKIWEDRKFQIFTTNENEARKIENFYKQAQISPETNKEVEVSLVRCLTRSDFFVTEFFQRAKILLDQNTILMIRNPLGSQELLNSDRTLQLKVVVRIREANPIHTFAPNCGLG